MAIELIPRCERCTATATIVVTAHALERLETPMHTIVMLTKVIKADEVLGAHRTLKAFATVLRSMMGLKVGFPSVADSGGKTLWFVTDEALL
jgi:hypothetical protein